MTADCLALVAAAQKLKSKMLIIDGEIVAMYEVGRPFFQALEHRGSKQSPVACYAFNLLHRDGRDFRQYRSTNDARNSRD